jgi:Ca2+:H+ antiporter
VDTVDVVLGSGSIDEKFLGFTLFALVPNTTEFLNAISFALNGNIALRYVLINPTNRSMEIGSAYALQVCLLQIPALVAVSAVLNSGKTEFAEYVFSLMFPRWDLITVILCVFLLAYMYGEGKSNYFKVRMGCSRLIAGEYFDAGLWSRVDGWVLYPAISSGGDERGGPREDRVIV